VRNHSIAASLLIVLIGLVDARPALAQNTPDLVKLSEQRAMEAAFQAQEEERQLATRTPLQVQVVVSRFQGEKRISALPYVVSVNANDSELSRLRMGARVPVPSMSGMEKLGMPVVGPVTYEEIGTNIDCQVRSRGKDVYEVVISVEDRSVYPNSKDPSVPTVGDLPVFRSFQSRNTLIMRDGQTRQFTAATDRVSGEIIRVEVTLTVVK
jgi:hypothetical protein